MPRDKVENHDWVPVFIFEYTNFDRPVTIILYCSHCKRYRYQYGEKLT